MSQIDRILHLLADGQFHSGEKIGEMLGVTRSAVWQTLNKALDPTLELQAIRKRGYRIPGGVELLDETNIRAELGLAAPELSHLEILKTVDSTNRYLQAKQDLRSGYAVLAEQQTAGRGRLGRKWVAPFGRNIYLSLLWDFPAGSTSLIGLSLVVGVAVVSALESFGLTNVGLKWPNDIMYGQRKLGGILLEISGDAAGPCQVVIGVGLNLQMPQSVSAEINQPWIDLRSITMQKIQRNKLAGILLRELLTVLPKFQKKGWSEFRGQWEALDVLYGQAVNVHTAHGILSGIAQGIDELGNLQVKIGHQIQSFNSGEVSIRFAENKTPIEIAI